MLITVISLFSRPNDLLISSTLEGDLLKRRLIRGGAK